MSRWPLRAIHGGGQAPPPSVTPLRAGPLAMLYEAGDLRYVRLGDREVVRRIYVAVRDRNWGTVPPRMTGERLEVREDSFRMTYLMEHTRGAIDFCWEGEIRGDADGVITFTMDGRARSDFLRNRIGFCILHPIRECAGARCRVEWADGTAVDAAFPRFIAPEAPFRDLTALAHEVEPGLWAELRMTGDLFEMEDQRNWIDASFKTFCTPLRLPFPVEVLAGTRVCQSVSLRLQGRPAVARPRGTGLHFEVRHDAAGPVPAIGLTQAGHGLPLTAREVELIRRLNLTHLRVDLQLWRPDAGPRLRLAAREAEALGIPLEAAVYVSDAADSELGRFVEGLRSLRPSVRRWLVFHAGEWSTTERWALLARRHLARYDPEVPLVSGTDANFAELNRGRPPVGALDGICYAAHPQEHAFDNRSMAETIAALVSTVESAREFGGGLPLTVSPITLRKRVNPYATGPAPEPGPDELPARVDVRQMSLFGAGWTLGSLKALGEGGVASVTYYETTGWLGVMETEGGSPLPGLFPSRPGAVFPMYHVLADVGEFAGGRVISSRSDDPLHVEGLALRMDGTTRILIANLTDEPKDVTVVGLGASVRLKDLDETSAEWATSEPEAYRADPGRPVRSDGGRLALRLLPYAIARIDAE